MSAPTTELWRCLLPQVAQAAGMLLILTSCDKVEQTTQSALLSKDQSAKAPSPASENQSDKARMETAQSLNVVGQVGSAFDQLLFEREFGKPLQVPIGIPSGATDIQHVSFRGDASGPVRVVTVTVKSQAVAAIEITLDVSGPSGVKLQAELLEGYTHHKVHSVTMLDRNLNESVQSFNELERSSTRIRVLTQTHGHAVRMIFCDPSLIEAERMLPSTKELPPGLLEKARSIVDKQKQFFEQLQK